jgi:hypothetical protein
MTIYYAVDYDVDFSATVSGVKAFRSKIFRDNFVICTNKRYAITPRGADIACRRSHDCTARKAYDKGMI